MRERLTIALDKSVRRIDQDGHLHVAASNISKAAVNGYRGGEIPDHEKLGLDPRRIYQLLRHPDELAKGADSFAGKPLLSIHKPLTATDHAHRLTVGHIGGPVSFDGTYLRAPLTVWDADAIAGIEQDEQRELSCGYRYAADMTPGVWNGQRYDGVMRDIRGNHVALVESGRAGSDVMVGDSALVAHPLAPVSNAFIVRRPQSMKLSRAALLTSGALRVYLAPKLASDQKLDLAPILKTVTAKTWKQDKLRIKTALDAALKGKLAQDADLDEVADVLEQLNDTIDDLADEPMAPRQIDESEPLVEDDDGDATNRVREFLTGKLSPEDLDSVLTMLKPEVDPATDADPAAMPPKPKKPEDTTGKTTITKAAMDQAIKLASDSAARNAERATIAKMNAIREAERLVRPLIGELAIAQDSAEAVFKLALDHVEVDVEGVPPSAYGAMVKMALKQQGEARAAPKPRMAHDSAADADLLKQFPGLTKLKAR